jgi:phosphoglucomutase
MTGGVSPLAARTLDPSQLVDVSRLIGAYFSGVPDPPMEVQRVALGTSAVFAIVKCAKISSCL